MRGYDGPPLYSSDCARQYVYHPGTPPISLIGEIELSKLPIGFVTDPLGLVRSDLLISLHAVGYENFCAAVVSARTLITPIDSSSYSYPMLRSFPPYGEWTVGIIGF